ncbi:hypothetical protein ABEF92_000018 [Exophiala dermatitidis]|uniref:Metallo-beta-lactamase domain-containing protein n=1 Tax=Exophiala dermatitidis (strain ATCC 34100 / CBS 525.76 / NIH/UT8656) TaxID=858893 RepID=H6C443_EXODN|nr:uncharacterized protein HMPREF1120_05598 [Exophiala dermatitidis NIH/UT8656]EHY57568.1 hypothetical protein HMPREF1120_05598 [Exophiala dermatitidis NIH/UT8656]
MATTLRADLYVAPPIPWAKPNGQQGGVWSPISCTLIHGSEEAVLVDTPITTSQTESLVAWIKERIPTKKLVKIYITHGHGDHWFGEPTLMKHFPNAVPIATPKVVAYIKEHLRNRMGVMGNAVPWSNRRTKVPPATV